MVANRMLLVSVVVGGLLVGCGKEKRAEEAQPPAASPAPPAAIRKPAAKRAGRPASKPAAKPSTKTAAKPSTKPASSALVLGVPEAHLPPAGQCRIWKAGATPFQQPQSRSCDGIVPTAPAGSMVLERPGKDSKVIRVRYIDAYKAGHVAGVRVFDATSGKYLRD